MKERLDNKDIHARIIDIVDALKRLALFHPEEFEVVLICGLFHVPFRDAESILGTDHVSIHDTYSSGVAHLTDYLNGVTNGGSYSL